MERVPPEVTEASLRLQEHAVIQPATMPVVFQEIVKNYNRRAQILRQETTTPADWRELQELRRDLKQNLIPGAEAALSWNQDKGQDR